MRRAHFCFWFCLLVVACSEPSRPPVPESGVADRTADSLGDGGSRCVSNPTTHVEIINACTTAQSYDKTPFYPELAPNGVLPPLP